MLQGHPMIKTVGMSITDDKCVDTLLPLVVDVVDRLHPFFKNSGNAGMQKCDMDVSKLNPEKRVLDPSKVACVKVRLSRNL